MKKIIGLALEKIHGDLSRKLNESFTKGNQIEQEKGENTGGKDFNNLRKEMYNVMKNAQKDLSKIIIDLYSREEFEDD